MVSFHILEDSNFGSLLVYDIIIDGDDEHEGKKDASATENVPDIMPEEQGENTTKKDEHLTCRRSPKDSKADLTPVTLQASCWSPSQSF